MQQTQVRSLGRKDALEKDIAAYSSILAWRIPWIEEPGGLLSMRLQRVEYNLVTKSSGTSNCRPLPSLSQQAEGLAFISMFQRQAWAS